MSVDDISVVLISLIRIGAIFRFIYCMVRLQSAEEERGRYKKRAKNIVFFYILSESIWQIKEIVFYYYS
ncbi:MAG: mercury transporter [Clostridiales bacterium]|nr:mercury transporter [Clostridiales bacterium]